MKRHPGVKTLTLTLRTQLTSYRASALTGAYLAHDLGASPTPAS